MCAQGTTVRHGETRLTMSAYDAFLAATSPPWRLWYFSYLQHREAEEETYFGAQVRGKGAYSTYAPPQIRGEIKLERSSVGWAMNYFKR